MLFPQKSCRLYPLSMYLYLYESLCGILNYGMLDKKTQQVCEGCRLKEGKKGMEKYLKALPDSEERGDRCSS